MYSASNFLRKIRVFLAIECTALAIAAAPAIAQVTPASAITGAVTDPDGRAVVGAAIVVQTAAGQSWTAVTDSSGRFSVPALAAGTYGVEASAKGLANRRVEVTLKPGQSRDVGLQLEIGSL